MTFDVVDQRVQTERVRVNGVDLFVRSVGTGPAVIVLHGGPGAHHDYLLPQFDALAVGRCLRYYDQRGGGRSSVARGVAVGWHTHVRDLDALLDHWTIGSATLLGYSWGGLLALLYAVRHPGRVGRLALVSPAPVTARGRADFYRRFAERMRDPLIDRTRRALRRSGLRQRNPTAYRQRAFELSVAGYFKDYTRARDLTPFRVTSRTQHAVWQSLGHYDLSNQLSGLNIPTLIVHGRYDPIPLSTAEYTARLLNARLEVLDDAGHVPHVEDFDRFVAVLDAFLPQAT